MCFISALLRLTGCWMIFDAAMSLNLAPDLVNPHGIFSFFVFLSWAPTASISMPSMGFTVDGQLLIKFIYLKLLHLWYTFRNLFGVVHLVEPNDIPWAENPVSFRKPHIITIAVMVLRMHNTHTLNASISNLGSSACPDFDCPGLSPCT
jgi:hypothetical protein